MDNWQREPDFSWMSFKPEAHGITPRIGVWPGSNNSSKQDQQQKPSKSSEWREQEIVEEPEEEEELLLRRRRARGKEQARKVSEDFEDDDRNGSFDGASSSSSAPPAPPGPMKSGWDGVRKPYLFSPQSLKRGFQTRKKSWMESSDEDDAIHNKLSWTREYPRLQFAARVAIICSLVALAIGIFLIYLSLATARPPHACEVDKVVLNFTAQRIRLRGGRYISFREQGVAADKAQHSLLVVHDLLSSRLAGIPGISESLLEEFAVRLISYDRPGYGQSDPHPGRSYHSSAQDMSDIAEALGMGEKFWVIGFGNGGPHVWAAINYIPERLAGVALFAPAGNFYGDNMTKDEIAKTWGVLTLRQKWMYAIARLFPALLPSLLQKTLVKDNPSPLRAMGTTLGSKDRALMEREEILKFWKDNAREALQQQCAFPMTEELILLVNKWGFSLADLPFHVQEVKTLWQQVVSLFKTKEKPRIFSGPIHIWQGTDDPHVPAAMNEYAKRVIHRNDFAKKMGSLVDLHILEGEGHLSWFWFCDECHQTIFDTLFRPEEMLQGPVHPVHPVDHQGFSAQEFQAILAAFGGPKEVWDKSSLRKKAPKVMDGLLGETRDEEEEVNDELPTGVMVYVPESCQVPVDGSSILRAIDKVRKYIS